MEGALVHWIVTIYSPRYTFPWSSEGASFVMMPQDVICSWDVEWGNVHQKLLLASSVEMLLFSPRRRQRRASPQAQVEERSLDNGVYNYPLSVTARRQSVCDLGHKREVQGDHGAIWGKLRAVWVDRQ